MPRLPISLAGISAAVRATLESSSSETTLREAAVDEADVIVAVYLFGSYARGTADATVTSTSGCCTPRHQPPRC